MFPLRGHIPGDGLDWWLPVLGSLGFLKERQRPWGEGEIESQDVHTYKLDIGGIWPWAAIGRSFCAVTQWSNLITTTVTRSVYFVYIAKLYKEHL